MAVEFKELMELSDEELAEIITNDLAQSVAYRTPALQANQRYQDMYQVQDDPALGPRLGKGDLQEDESLWSNTYLPVGTTIANVAIQHIWLNTIGGNPDYLRCEPNDPRDWKGAIFCAKHLKNRHLQMGFKETVFSLIQEGVLYDYAIALNHWRFEGGYELQRVDSEEELAFKNGAKFMFGSTRSEEVWNPQKIDRVQTDVLNNMRTFFDPASRRGFDDSEFFIDVRDESPRVLMDNRRTKDNPFGIYDFNPNEIETGKTHLFSKVGDWKDKRIASQSLNSVMNDNSKRVHIVRYWTPNFMAEMTGNHKIIRRRHMTGYPLTKFTLFPLSNRFEGMGLLQPIERMQIDINAIVNSKRDYESLVLDPMAVVDASVQGAEGDVQLHPGKIFISDDGVADKVEIIKPGADIGGASTQEIELQLGMISRVSNTGPNASGQFASGRRSATEASEVSQALDTSMGVSSLRFENLMLEPIYDQQLHFERVNMTRTEVFRQAGPEGEYFWQVDREQLTLYSNPTFRALGMSHIMQTALQRAQLIQMVNTVMANPSMAKHVDEKAVVQELFRQYRPADYNDFLREQPQGVSPNIPPEMEHTLFARGHRVDVSPENDHQEHSLTHGTFMASQDFQLWPDVLKQKLIQHKAVHDQMAQRGAPSINAGASPQTGANLLQGSPIAETAVNPEGANAVAA